MDDIDFLLLLCLFNLVHNYLCARKKTLVLVALQCSELRNDVVKVNDWFEKTVPLMLPREFRRFFRMYDDTLSELIRRVSRFARVHKISPRAVSIPKKVSMTCTYLGTSTPVLHLAHMFGVCEEVFLRSTEEVMDCLVDMADEIIRFPTPQEFRAVSNRFNLTGRRFPNTVGCLDSTHIKGYFPNNRHKMSYYNYKKFFSLHLMAVCLPDLCFSYIFAGWPGRSHDAHVFTQSDLNSHLENWLRTPGLQVQATYHLIADSAYPCLKQIMTPYRCVAPLTPRETKYNTHLSSQRQAIERAFGLLKMRFKRLLGLNQQSRRKMVKGIIASCVLHNIVIKENDNVGHYLRQALRYLRRQRQPRRPTYTALNSRAGMFKRNLLKNIVATYP